ncbi:MAG: peptide deformylase [Rhodospirillaceae bacterium]|nr:peptide deformylase [Rhodospirillaceae bacterium]
MPIRQIAKMGHPVLLKPAVAVDDPQHPDIARLAADMQDTLEWIGAAGIAGPQVYDRRRVVVYRISAERIAPSAGMEPVPWTVMINPVVTPIGEEKGMIWERCLSLPGLHGKVPRHTKIHISFQTLEGKEQEREAEDWHAMLLQHECDHLDGILYPMRMTDLSLLAFNAEPGNLAVDAEKNPGLDPALRAMVDAWPAREKWLAD